MSEIEKLKEEIEEARRELDASISKYGLAACYEKSKEVDRLIEKYIMIEESSG